MSEPMYRAFARGERSTSSADGPAGPIYLAQSSLAGHGPHVRIYQERPDGKTECVHMSLEQVNQTIAALEVWRVLAEHGA